MIPTSIQVVEVLPDTGSSQLWLPTTICHACNQVSPCHRKHAQHTNGDS